MRNPDLPCGFTRRLSLLINSEWSPEQALAVFELLGDLRKRLSMQYGFESAYSDEDDRRFRRMVTADSGRR
ncbi:MAG: hypothetical protein ACYCXX_10525 [Acidiferrobacter thiooxydans]